MFPHEVFDNSTDRHKLVVLGVEGFQLHRDELGLKELLPLFAIPRRSLRKDCHDATNYAFVLRCSNQGECFRGFSDACPGTLPLFSFSRSEPE